MCLRLYLTCRGQGRSSSHGTICTTVLLTKHCFGNNWIYTFCKAFSSAEKIWPDDFFFFLAIFLTFSLCHAQVNVELNTRLNFHSGWEWCSANAMYESEAMSQINGNEMFHFSSSPKSDSLLGGVSAEETCFLFSIIIKSNQSSKHLKISVSRIIRIKTSAQSCTPCFLFFLVLFGDACIFKRRI